MDIKIKSVDEKNNMIVENIPTIKNSSIIFNGNNNVLFCEEDVIIEDSNLKFNGDNSLIYLRTGCHRLKISLFNDYVCHCGLYNWYTKPLWIVLSEHKHCFIGDNCMFSFDILIRNSDHHLIYDCENNKRINPTKSVFIGDHVWIGQLVNILKGTRIDSGSIVGASSVVAGKKIPHNTIWAGNPSQEKKCGVFWDKTCVHGFCELDTELSMNYGTYLNKYRNDCNIDYWKFEYNDNEYISYDYLDEKMSTGTVMEKCYFLKELNNNKQKNRFVHF